MHSGVDFNYEPLDRDGNVLRYTSGYNRKVSNNMREEASLMYLSLDRLSHQQIKPSNWVIYGKLLKYICNQISDEQKQLFIDNLNSNYADNILPHVQPIENRLREYVNEQIGRNIALRLSLINPTMVIRDLRPRISDNLPLEVDIDEEGAGVQSSVAIAIARVYAEVIGQPTIIALEEPELYLHPHACRHFYRILSNLSEQNVQILYATHERSFVNIGDYLNINIVKKEIGETNVYKFSTEIEEFDPVRAISKFNEEINEVFFASRVVLVEGYDDKVACVLALEKLNVDVNNRNISIIECGGINEIKSISEIIRGFSIDCYVLVDEDPGNPATQTRRRQIEEIVGRANILLQSPNLESLFGYDGHFTKINALRFFPPFFRENQPPQVYFDLLARMNL
jgi:hypothetical protein